MRWECYRLEYLTTSLLGPSRWSKVVMREFGSVPLFNFKPHSTQEWAHKIPFLIYSSGLTIKIFMGMRYSVNVETGENEVVVGFQWKSLVIGRVGMLNPYSAIGQRLNLCWISSEPRPKCRDLFSLGHSDNVVQTLDSKENIFCPLDSLYGYLHLHSFS